MGFLEDYGRELEAKANTPAQREADARTFARAAARSAEQHAKGVRLGWWDEDGNSLLPPDDEDEEAGE